MSRPTTMPYEWATDPGARESVSALIQASGWVAGEPVPAELLNGLLGLMSDWIRYSARAETVRTFRTGFAVPVFSVGDVAAATTGSLQTSEPSAPESGFGCRLYNDGTQSAYAAVFANAFYLEGGSAVAVGLDMSDTLVSSADGVLKVSLSDHEGNLVTYSAVPSATTGEVLLTYDPSESVGSGTTSEELDGWVDVYFSFQVSATSGDFIDIASIAIAI